MHFGCSMKTGTRNRPVERRKNRRFSAHEGAFVCFNSKPAMTGRILDLSLGGLGFIYLASNRRTADLFNLDILCVPCDFSLLTIPVRTISDFEMTGTTFDSQRRSGLQFDRLTQDQMHEIRKLIEACTQGSV